MTAMPCSISDGPQTPEDDVWPAAPDEDEAYEQLRQQQIDDKIAPNGLGARSE